MDMLHVVDFVPLVAERFGLHPRGLLGWSMGGYGALLAAERDPARFPAVAVSSAAVWQSYAQQHAAVPDAFDGRADFARNDVFAGAGRLARVAVSISCGTSDPVPRERPGPRLPPAPASGGRVRGGVSRRGHWRRMLPAQVRFLGRHMPS
jgi:pimeloyl-ACP methyl ester carboxylesterase